MYNDTMTYCGPKVFGADPANIKWTVVRGDTAKLRVEFLEDDEITYFDISGWEFLSSTYDFRGDVVDPLTVEVGEGFVDIIASSAITAEWGSGFTKLVAELAFDLQVTLDDNTVWTPVVGTISVIGDVTGVL
jgi:hypothetical protein